MARQKYGKASPQSLWVVVLMSTAWSIPASMAQNPAQTPAQTPVASAAAACPLNFTVLDEYTSVAETVRNSNNSTLQCEVLESGLEAVIANYLQESDFFLIPVGTSSACMNAYQTQIQSQGVTGFNISEVCAGYEFFSERGTDLCHDIQSAQDFRNLVPVEELNALNSSCSQNLQTITQCGLCNTAINSISVTLYETPGGHNYSCVDFVNVYTVAIVHKLDPASAICILYISAVNGGGKDRNLIFIAVGVGGMLLVCIIGALVFYTRFRRKRAQDREARKKRTKDLLSATSVPASSINWFDIDELKRATGNFSRENILGTGGYGNVYKGTLANGSVIAVKRFKNCSPAGDADFVHEVEMISSVRHRNLVGIRGCCVDSGGMAGHQRMIIYDFMPNGSLQEHLFWKIDRPGQITLDWPTRRNVAIGVARGLTYLHHDAVPAIFHRDIKASNILLDADFNALLADFGLAKFTPEGVSHVTTRVAGTYGYVAPEYALYGQLTEKSDVYGFGMVILELVTGRKALSSAADDPPHVLLADWAWPLVKQGRWKSIIDPRIADSMGSDEEMERFILVGLLSAHPQLFYRPSIDQALKMLENNAFGVPNVPDRPLRLTSNQAEIQEALSQESRERQDRSNRTGYSAYSLSSVSSTFSDATVSHSNSLREENVSLGRAKDLEDG